MSKNSIKERNKAIRKAWEREQVLVSEGKGTRDWTKEQQKDILDPDKGKAYDEDGRAFEGQHMKSAAEYPEYQGDPDNIQFLTRDEHLEAHKGSWQNPTNWYYNPETKEFVDFGENRYTSCKIIALTDPVVRMNEAIQVSPETTEVLQKEEKEKNSVNEQGRDTLLKNPGVSAPLTAKTSTKVSKSFREKIMDFGGRHPVLTGVLKVVGIAVVAVGTEAIASICKGSGGGSRSSSSEDYFSSTSDDGYADSLDTDGYDDTLPGRDYPDERSSPEKHMVQGHGQHYHTKDGIIWKEKEPYPRGGKHEDD